MANLHQDIVFEIFVRLPVKSIVRFRCVSKAWCKLLKDPKFFVVRKNLNLAVDMNKFSLMMLSGRRIPGFGFLDSKDTYTLAYDPSLSTLSNRVPLNYPPRNASFGILIWGTCNGLICLTPSAGNYEVVLWNPTTKEFKEVPSVPNELGNEFSYCQYAFGYDDKTEDFKVVSFVGSEDESLCEVQVYTLMSDSWRRLENIPWLLCAGEIIMAQVSVHEATHWLAPIESTPDQVIASFDFKDERFNEMPLPSFYSEYAEMQLCQLRGSLCLHGSIGGRTDVWEMNAYGVAESWAKLFTVNQDTLSQFSLRLDPLQFVKNDEVLVGYETDAGYHLDLYGIKHGTSLNLKAYPKRNSYYATSFVYVESPVTLNSGTYVELQEIEDF